MAASDGVRRVEFTREEIDYVAHLARIALSEEERALFGSQLASILGYFRKLEELDTGGVPATAHPLGVRNVFRDDAPGESVPPAELLANAPRHRCGCYEVPRILE